MQNHNIPERRNISFVSLKTDLVGEQTVVQYYRLCSLSKVQQSSQLHYVFLPMYIIKMSPDSKIVWLNGRLV